MTERKSLKILLVEDDPNISTIARLALEKLGGHSVLLASDGESALNQCQQDAFDVILLDEMMPRLNGLAVCRELIQRGSKTPVIFLSAKSQDSDLVEFHKIAQGYIAKPFDPQQLHLQIEEKLNAIDREER